MSDFVASGESEAAVSCLSQDSVISVSETTIEIAPASVSDNGYDGDGEESVGFGGGADSDAEGLGEEEATAEGLGTRSG
ncbi:hypothetical protein BRADI_2g42643v3 [Brachypodium distachyon]|uniref:Uncharacterized protein n=1 Tax=Brachypodium distachyon TaxID=15368 RepID=A0A0Q3R511_BRADI|nr:hypothetical protein BRADI_2g42643v3 [Brachypodium distachyon]